MGRREQDVYRHQISVFADKVFHGEVEGLRLQFSKMPEDKYLALCSFLELDLYDLMAPAPFDPAKVNVEGMDPDKATQEINRTKLSTQKARDELFAWFEGFSRARTAGLTDRVDFRQNMMLFLRIVGKLGQVISGWADIEEMGAAEVEQTLTELQIQGRRPPPMLMPPPPERSPIEVAFQESKAAHE
ncbi:MAG: hypothetical protein ACLP74_01495 [Thermoplasmata archaeon]